MCCFSVKGVGSTHLEQRLHRFPTGMRRSSGSARGSRSSPGRHGIPIVVILAGLSLASAAVHAQCAGSGWGLEGFGGTSWHIPVPIVVELPEGRTEFRAHYSTRPFTQAPYYSYRIARSWSHGHAVEVEMLHNKLYLENPRPPIERFEVSHGYNQPMVNAVWPSGGWRFRVGLGIVIAHPEGTIGGRSVRGRHTLIGNGYHIAGVTMQAAIGRRYVLWGERVPVTAAPEVKITASWASVPFGGDGRVNMPDVSLHALAGLGVWRCR